MVNKEELEYLNILNTILNEGNYRSGRNGGTKSIFGKQLTFDLSDYKLPLLTTKKMFARGIFEELAFFLTGSSDSKILESKNVNIWKANTSREFLDSVGLTHYREGDMGPLYSFQLRHYGAQYEGCDADYTNKGIDQLWNVVNLLVDDRYSRRIMMTTYNPTQTSLGPLPPCHGLVIQFYVDNDNKLSCHMYQRSADWFLGVPFNIASYAFLVFLIIEMVNSRLVSRGESNLLSPGQLIMSFGDIHLYETHFGVAEIQRLRTPYEFPKVVIKNVGSCTTYEEFNETVNNLSFQTNVEIIGYQSHDALKADMVA